MEGDMHLLDYSPTGAGDDTTTCNTTEGYAFFSGGEVHGGTLMGDNNIYLKLADTSVFADEKKFNALLRDSVSVKVETKNCGVGFFVVLDIV